MTDKELLDTAVTEANEHYDMIDVPAWHRNDTLRDDLYTQLCMK